MTTIHTGARFSVMRARRSDGARVIIKQVLPGRPPELRSAERLRHEYELLDRLQLPSVSRPLDFTTVDGKPSLVIEDAGAHSLSRFLSGRPLAIDKFLELAILMAQSVGQIHAHNVIHRDLCPDNFV